MRGTALVRRPSSRLAEGIVTHIERSVVDLGLARRQHEGYRAALAGHGWRVQGVPEADDCPDSVFIEDTVVVCGGTAVITRLGAPSRRPETDAVEATVRELGLAVASIEKPGTLDGGCRTVRLSPGATSSTDRPFPERVRCPRNAARTCCPSGTLTC